MPVAGILFDKDGTLIDFERTFAPATDAVIAALAGEDHLLRERLALAACFDLPQQRFHRDSIAIGGTNRDIARLWLPLLAGWSLEPLTMRIDRLYEAYSVSHLTPFDTLLPTLEALDTLGIPVGIATNDSEANARRHLEKLGVAARWAFVAGYDSGHGSKPAGGMVAAFARFLGVTPDRIWMVGDSAHDIEEARAGGAVAIAVTSGIAERGHLAPHADHVLEGIGELPALIRRFADRRDGANRCREDAKPITPTGR